MKTLKNLILCLVLLCAATLLGAQAPQWQWAVNAGGTRVDLGNGIALDNAGNSYVTGGFYGTATFGSYDITAASRNWNDIFVAKVDADGNWLWAKSAGGDRSDIGQGIAIDGEGNVYVTGWFGGTATFGNQSLTSDGDTEIFVAKLDADGNWLWAKRAGGTTMDSSVGIAVDGDGNIYVTGMFGGTANFGSHTLTASEEGNICYDIFVAKLDSSGNWLWATGAGSPLYDTGLGIALDSEGNALVTGSFKETASFGSHTLTSSGDTDIFVAKIDADGDWLWAKKAGGSDSDEGRAIVLDDADNIYLTGYFIGSASFGSHTLTSYGCDDIFVAKLDANGNWLWATKAGGSLYDSGRGIALDSKGNAYVTGGFVNSATFGSHTLTISGEGEGFYDRKAIFVAKLDADGEWLWAVQAGGSDSSEMGCDIVLDSAGYPYVTGRFAETAAFGDHSITSSGNDDIFVAKLGNSTPVDDDLAPQVASRLHDAWPNPFGGSTGTMIKADIPERSTGTLSIYNLRGQRVARYELSSGSHEINFAGENLPAGIYLYSLQCGDTRETKKMVLLR